jgi:pyruvate,water dikinase
MASSLIIPLEDFSASTVAKVGGKSASLASMIHGLKGLPIPSGFTVTTDAYRRFMEFNSLNGFIGDQMGRIKDGDLTSLRRSGLAIRTAIVNGEMPHELYREIARAYRTLSLAYKDAEGNPQEATDVAVRSSATAEDTKDASFAGQQDTYLNIRGEKMVVNGVLKCFASLYTDRAISYRSKQKTAFEDLALAVLVQKMVRSDLGSSGVAFSLDPDSGHRGFITVNSTWGLGELLVSGQVTADEFLVFKSSGLHCDRMSIIDRRLGNKTHRLVYGDYDEPTTLIPVSTKDQEAWSLGDGQVLELASAVRTIETYYGFPVDVEWGLDGLSGRLFIVQARPETVHSGKEPNTLKSEVCYSLPPEEHRPPLKCTGIGVGKGVVSGKVHLMHSLDNRYGDESAVFPEGCILVTESTDPDWEPLMAKSAGIVTAKGARCCHSAIVARELGIPAIVGTEVALDLLTEGEEITLVCCEGEVGKVYEGSMEVKTEVLKWDHLDLKACPVPLLLNVGNPASALSASLLPSGGIGLARLEFIINHFIGHHPLALFEERGPFKGYKDGPTYFVERLASGVARLASAFYPRPIIVRFSDFKSNEYRALAGGETYEPHEENPMIGWRGASRYYSSAYAKAFGLECVAIQKVRETMGLTNVKVMVPFCRTPDEMRQVLTTMEANGLKRGYLGLEVYLMCEIPSNVIMASEFATLVDGFSIGSNDLTQLTLGLDRDSELVAHLYDERNPAVKAMISQAIRKAKEAGIKIGICGQGPSDFPDFAEFLVRAGIDTISVTPDSLYRTYATLGSLST